MKTKKIISMLLTACISLSTMAGLCTTASAETTSKTVYDGTGYTTSQTDNTWHSLYTGDRLSGANGEKYTITFEGKSYNNVQGYDFTLCDGDKTAKLYNKKNYLTNGNNTYESGTVVINNNGESLFNVKAVIDVDFSGATPTAKVKVYDHDLTTVLINKTVSLTGFTGISDVVYDTWGTDTGFEKPQSPKLKIEKQVEVVNKTVVENSYEWESCPKESIQNYLLYQGSDVSGTNGEKYTITYKTKVYSGVNGYNIWFYDGDKSVLIYQKGNGNFIKQNTSDEVGNAITVSQAENGKFMNAVIEVDFSTAIPTAHVVVYDTDGTTVLLNKSVDLTGFTKITKIICNVWDTAQYTMPHDVTLTITKQVELKKESVYSGTGYTDRGTTPHSYSFYTGERLSGANGERYIINFVGYSLTSVTKYDFKLYDGTRSVALYYKSNNKNQYDDKFDVTFPANTNPFNVKAVIDVDFSTDKATVKVYDHDLTTVLVNKTVDLAGLTGISDVVWELADDGNVTYSYPYGTPSLTIYKITEDGADNVQDIELKSAKLESGSVKVDLTINAVDKAVPYAIIAAFYNGNLLVKTQIKSGTVAIGEKKESESFAPPTADYDKAYIYLWDGMSTLKPYDAPVQVSLN